MKKILLLILVCFISQIAYSDTQGMNSQQETVQKMKNDNSEYFKKCSELSNIFKFDSRFANHLRSTCTDFESERERVLSIIYSNNYDSVTGTRRNYIANKAALSAKMNSDKLESYKEIIREYCKYNKSNIAEKSPQACVKAGSLFN